MLNVLLYFVVILRSCFYSWVFFVCVCVVAVAVFLGGGTVQQSDLGRKGSGGSGSAGARQGIHQVYCCFGSIFLIVFRFRCVCRSPEHDRPFCSYCRTRAMNSGRQ